MENAARERNAPVENFREDVLSLVTEKPVLLSDLISSLRGGLFGQALASGRRWKNVNQERVEDLLRDFGAFFRNRVHGAGRAVYVASVPFSTVVDGRGRTQEVR